MPSISVCLQEAEQLQSASDTAKLDAEVLLAYVLGNSRTYLYTWPEIEVSSAQYSQFQQLMISRKRGEPIAYLTGQQEFWSLPLRTNRDTLIPRPETELLIEIILAFSEARDNTKKVLDLGTGTGAIALALAHERPKWHIQGVDVMPAAVNVAKENAKSLNINNATFHESNWFDFFNEKNKFTIIVSNPPYIDAKDAHLKEGDVRFEPCSALVANEKGLADLRFIIETAHAYLLPGGRLLLEHGWQQGKAVRQLFEATGYSHVISCNDLSGHERVTHGIWEAHR